MRRSSNERSELASGCPDHRFEMRQGCPEAISVILNVPTAVSAPAFGEGMAQVRGKRLTEGTLRAKHFSDQRQPSLFGNGIVESE